MKFAAAVGLIACALVLGASAGTLPLVPWYTCDPATCKPENNCRCASYEAPLPQDEMPQFILFTHDDAVIPEVVDAINQTVGDRTNPNGCTLPLTWFTIKYGTEPYCNLVKQLWRQGHEIAIHTRDHIRLDEPVTGDKEDQMRSVKVWLNETCRIPLETMVGMRDPFLVNNPGTRKVQHDMGLLYDSTINEHWTRDNMWPTSANGSARLWPYSMDEGIPQKCDAVMDGVCTQDERYPGLWEVPVWVLQTANYPLDAYAMDPGGDVFTLLKVNFDASYSGNRAPVPLYMHAPWMTQAQNQAYVSKFMDYALQQGRDSGKDNVWFVTMHQLIDWIRNPIPASQMKQRFNAGCQSGGAGAVSSQSIDVSPSPSPSSAPAAAPGPAASPAPMPVAAPSPAATPSPSPSPAAAAPSPVPDTAAPAPVPAAPSSGASTAAPAALVGALLAALALAVLL